MWLSIEQIDKDKFKVLEGHILSILTREQLIEKLSNPSKPEQEQDNFQKQLEEFWNSYPVYPRM